MKELEIEFKSSITEEEYKRFLQYFKVKDENIIPQTNYYFETRTNSLYKRGLSLRVRERLGIYELCMKESQEIGKLEHNHIISKEEFDTFKKNGIIPVKYIEESIGDQVFLSASLQTNRVEIPYKNGVVFLDESLYGGRKDFEIEFEVKDILDKKEFDLLLDEMNIPYRKIGSKTKRAFSVIEKKVK